MDWAICQDALKVSLSPTVCSFRVNVTPPHMVYPSPYTKCPLLSSSSTQSYMSINGFPTHPGCCLFSRSLSPLPSPPPSLIFFQRGNAFPSLYSNCGVMCVYMSLHCTRVVRPWFPLRNAVQGERPKSLPGIQYILPPRSLQVSTSVDPPGTPRVLPPRISFLPSNRCLAPGRALGV